MTPRVERALRAWVSSVVIGCYRPRPKIGVADWACKHVYLSRKESPGSPGYYSLELTPYARFIHDFVTDPDWGEFILMKSSQSGFTQAILNIILWIAVHAPTNVIYAINSRDEARRISRARIQPALRRVLGADGREEEATDGAAWSSLTIYLEEMAIYLSGGHSAGALANKSCGLGIVDEVDEHPEPPPGEAHSIDLVRDRLKAVPGAKLICVGKPKTTDHAMSREWATGTQHRLFVPCPLCGGMQHLEWQQVKFDHCKDLTGEYDLDRVAAETCYECVHCKGRIGEGHKREMVMAGEWRSTNHNHAPRKISAHISDLYSLFPSSSWGALANEWIEATHSGDLVKLQKFFNSRLGLPWQQRQSEVQEKDVQRCAGPYRMRDEENPGWLPLAPACLCMAADVQGDVVKWVRGGFNPEGALWVADYGYVLAMDELLDVFAEPIQCRTPEGAVEATCQWGLIDEGYKTSDVRDFCLRSDGRFWPAKGRGSIQARRTVAESVSPHAGRQIVTYHFNDDDFKRQLYITRIAMREKIDRGESRAPRLWIPENARADFHSELSSEKLVEQRTPRGYSVWKWIKTGANDFGDVCKLLLVIWHIVGHLYQEAPEPEETNRGA